MLNLVCFPHYTCGGLLCDILNDTFSAEYNGGVSNLCHNAGKIGDTLTVMSDFDPEKFQQKISQIELKDNTWISTHCWPGKLDLTQFNRVIVVTTCTNRSRVYRWVRTFNHYFAKTWTNLHGQELIDKSRETAKNYLVPFMPVFNFNVVNLEFAEVVENTKEFNIAIQGTQSDRHVKRWQQLNNFLYSEDFWNSFAVKRFHEADLEVALKRYYQYH